MSARTTALRTELVAVAIALAATLAIGSLFMMVARTSPGHVWLEMLTRTLANRHTVGDVLYRATAIALTGMAVAVALDAGLFNLGVEGQLSAGILACAITGTALPAGTPAFVAISLCTLAAAATGALFGAAIGAMRVYRGAHEVITSFMFNAIIIGISLWIGNAMLFQNGTTFGPPIVASAHLPRLPFGGSAVNAALGFAGAAVVGLWWLRSRTTWGHAMRAVGRQPATARAVGISVGRVQIAVLAGSGALAGLAAVNFVLGHTHAFAEGLGRGVGFMGVSAALVGRLHPVGVAVAAIGLAFLATAGLAVADLIPKELTEMLPGILLLSIVAAVPFVRRAAAVRT